MTWRALLASALIGLLAVVGSQPASAATTVLRDAQQVRSEVLGLTTDYTRKYADRVSPTERRELESMAIQARRELNALVRAVRRAQRTGSDSDWASAAARHEQARSRAEVNFGRARDILGPRLSLGEQFDALADYSSATRAFDALGERIGNQSVR